MSALDAILGWGGWAWSIAAAILIVLDIATPGLYLMWFGAAAALTAIFTFASGAMWPWQLVFFSTASMLALALGRAFFSPFQIKTDRPLLNERAQQLIGQIYVLDQPIAGGRGKLKIGDSLWSIAGPDMEAGARVIVTGADGSLLFVEPEQKPNLPKAGRFNP